MKITELWAWRDKYHASLELICLWSRTKWYSTEIDCLKRSKSRHIWCEPRLYTFGRIFEAIKTICYLVPPKSLWLIKILYSSEMVEWQFERLLFCSSRYQLKPCYGILTVIRMRNYTRKFVRYFRWSGALHMSKPIAIKSNEVERHSPHLKACINLNGR